LATIPVANIYPRAAKLREGSRRIVLRNASHLSVMRIRLAGRAQIQVSRVTGQVPYRNSTSPVTPASSTGRCNTIQCIDSAMLLHENHRCGCAWSKASQRSVPAVLSL